MTSKTKRLELNCLICSKPLTSTQICLSEDALNIIAEQNIMMRQKYDHQEYNRYLDIDPNQTVATKCGHIFHMGCLKNQIKGCIDLRGSPTCPMCKKPIQLTRVWPVLIPPTAAQLARQKRIQEMKTENNALKLELADIRNKIRDGELELRKMERETSDCMKDIERKQKILDGLQGQGPTDDEIKHLRSVHQKRQSIVRTVTKHNESLLGVLMDETNVQASQPDLSVSDYNFICSQNSSKKCDSKLGSIKSESCQDIAASSTDTFSHKTSCKTVVEVVGKDGMSWKAYPKDKFPNCPPQMRKELNNIAKIICDNKSEKISRNPDVAIALLNKTGRTKLVDENNNPRMRINEESVSWEPTEPVHTFSEQQQSLRSHVLGQAQKTKKSLNKKVPKHKFIAKPKWVN